MLFPVEDDVSDLQLRLCVGDSFDRPQTSHSTDREEKKKISGYCPQETLFLSRTRLQKVSESLLRNHAVKYLYLEGNELCTIPPTLFTSLPNLQWLDLRHNLIKSLPPEIGHHRFLRSLLLEGNPITELPAELGKVLSLTGLNLRDCPLRSPPRDVLERGVRSILQYLRAALAQRPVSAPKCLPGEPILTVYGGKVALKNAPQPSAPIVSDRTAAPQNSSFLPSCLSASVTSVPLETARTIRLTAQAADLPLVEKLPLELMGSSLEEEEEAGTQEEELQRFKELKLQMSLMEKTELETATHREKPKPIRPQRKKVTTSATPQQPSMAPLWNRPEERRQATMRELRAKEAILEQTRKNQEALHMWRSQSKNLEHSRQRQRMAGPWRKTVEAERDTRLAEEDSTDLPQCLPWITIDDKESSAARRLRQQIYGLIQKMEERQKNPTGSRQQLMEAAERDVQEMRRLQAQLVDMKRGRRRGLALTPAHLRQGNADK